MEVAPQVVDAEAAACLFGGEVEVEAGRHDKEQILTSKGHLETASAAHNIMDGLSTAEDVTPGERDADLTGTSVSPVDFGEVNKEVSTKPLGAAPTSDSLQGTGGAETVATVASEITVEGDAWPQDESKVPGEIPVVQGKSAVEGVSSQPETAALGTPGERDGDQTAASPVDFDEFSKEESIKPEGTAPASDYLQGTGGAETVATVAREIAPGPQDGLKVPSEVIVVQGETAVEGGSSQPETAVLGTADEKVEFLNQVGDGQESSSLLQVAGVADHCAALQKGAMDSKMDSKPLGGSEEVSLPQSAGSEGPNPPASQVQSGDPVLLQHEENITQEADDTSTMRVEDSVDSKMDWTPLIGSNEVTQSAGRQGQDLPSAPSSEAQNGDPVSLPREEDIILKADDTNTMPITDVIDSSMDWTPIGGSNEFTLPPENAVIEEQDAPTPQVPQLQNGDPNPLPIEEDASLKADDTSPLPHEEDITVKADSTSAISLQDAIDSKMEAKEISLKADDTSPTSLPHEEDITVQADSTGAISVQDTIDSKMEAKPLGGLKDVSPPQDASREVQDLPTPQASHVQNGDPVSLPHEENISRKVHDGTSTVPVKDVKHERDKKHETGRAKKHRKQRHKNGKKRKAEAESNTIDAEKVVKKGKTVSAATVNPPPEVPTVATRKITFKTRPRTPPSTPPEVAKKTAPRTPPKAPPKKMAKSTTPKSTTPRAGRGRKDDDGYAYFCALCHEFGELLCCEKCKQAFHLACLGLDRLPEADPWMCDNCLENKVECFDCKEFTAIEDDVLLCSFKNCSKFFHEECSKKWDRWDKGQLGKTSATKKPPGFTCPHHICDACGNTKTPKRSRLYRCLYCPVAYHENCAPDGTQFLEDVPGFMSCWKHDDDWKREIQTGERIMDLKTFFQQLPLPGVSNDFQVPQFIHEAVKKLNRKPSTYTHIRRSI